MIKAPFNIPYPKGKRTRPDTLRFVQSKTPKGSQYKCFPGPDYKWDGDILTFEQALERYPKHKYNWTEKR